MDYFTGNAALKQTHTNSTLAPAAANEEVLTSRLQVAKSQAGEMLPFFIHLLPCTTGYLQRPESALCVRH